MNRSILFIRNAERIGNLSGEEFITSVALGVDMMCRLALATMPGEVVFKTGWHLTSIFGFLGAAATAARLLRLDEERMVHAMGIGYHQSAGNGQCVIDGGLTKRLGPGFSVKGGVTAALMAQKGVTGARNCLDGESGLYRVYFQGKYDHNTLTRNLGESFGIVRVNSSGDKGLIVGMPGSTGTYMGGVRVYSPAKLLSN